MMIRAGLAIVTAVAVWSSAQDSQQPPVFRSSANAVLVDVSVRDGNRRAITGLTAADFTVTDNGVAQTVDAVSFGQLPIDVTVGLDISRSVTGKLQESLRAAVGQLMRDLRRGDRLKLILFNMRLARTIDFTTDVSQVERAIATATAGGATALFDALSLAMVSASQPERRQLIVFFTDGNDASSTTSRKMLQQISERTRATVTFVLSPTASMVSKTNTMTPSVSVPNRIADVPLPGSALNSFVFDPAIRQLAADTGGTVLTTELSNSLGMMFLQALDRFRSAYVLYYSPKGVDRTGFHLINVTVNRPGAVVQARRGYSGG